MTNGDTFHNIYDMVQPTSPPDTNGFHKWKRDWLVRFPAPLVSWGTWLVTDQQTDCLIGVDQVKLVQGSRDIFLELRIPNAQLRLD